jgi:hypothetical protein
MKTKAALTAAIQEVARIQDVVDFLELELASLRSRESVEPRPLAQVEADLAAARKALREATEICDDERRKACAAQQHRVERRGYPRRFCNAP